MKLGYTVALAFNEGGEVLHLSNPGEYPNDSIESGCDYEIIEVDD